MKTDVTKTLEELEDSDWGDPTHDSFLVATCHRLRRKPIQDFSVEDLRIMIGQGIGLEHLAPLALQELERNPFAEGDYYAGDLLKCLLDGASEDFWARHLALTRRMAQVLSEAEHMMPKLDQIDRETIQEYLAGVTAKIENIRRLANNRLDGTA